MGLRQNHIFEATLVFEAATKKPVCGDEAKTEGLISFATGFFSLIDYMTPFKLAFFHS